MYISTCAHTHAHIHVPPGSRTRPVRSDNPVPSHGEAPRGCRAGGRPGSIWGLDYDFTNSNFKKTLNAKKGNLNFTLLARCSLKEIKGCSEFIVRL